GRSSVTVKKRCSAEPALLMLGGCMPLCVWCSWKRRRSSTVRAFDRGEAWGQVERHGDLVDARPTYGYRRIAALLKRERRSAGMAPVNAKRVYRLMQRHGLLLARHTGRRRPRKHDGQVATLRSNIRWCSDGLEFTCWNGE